MRLFLLLFVALGLWLWRHGPGPKDRTFIWELPDSRPLHSADLQVWSQNGTLLKREQKFFAGAAPSEISTRVSLDEGRYQARAFIGYQTGASSAASDWVQVGRAEKYHLPSPRPTAVR